MSRARSAGAESSVRRPPLAWAVPAIQLATAVPAFAASGCCNVSVAGSAHWRANGLNYIDIPLDLSNGCNTAVTGLTVTLTICGIKDITYSGDTLPTGWTQLGKANKDLDPGRQRLLHAHLHHGEQRWRATPPRTRSSR